MMPDHQWQDDSSSTKSSSNSPPPTWSNEHAAEPRTSLVETLPTLCSAETQNVLHSIVKGRKSWKTLRGGEVVWPPELEAALLEGLENYQPDDSRETRLLGRFPLRNRFISDFIYHKTGKRRTAKQVGSRLQQLRDTCGGKQLLSLLSPCRKPGLRPSNHLYRSPGLESESSDSSLPNSPTSPTYGEANLPGAWSQKPLSPSVIHIDILPEDTYHSSSPVHSHGSQSSTTSPPPSPLDDSETVIRVSSEARPVRCIDPTITFLARSPISATSTFTVLVNGVSVHTETTSLTPQTSADISGGCLYSTTLVPNYWRIIVESSDPAQYDIQQTVVKEDQSLIYSAVYKFRYPASYTSSSSPYLAFNSSTSSQPHFSFASDAAETDMATVSGLNHIKAENYYQFGQFDGVWHSRSYTPRSDSTNNSTEYRHQAFDEHDSSRSNSLSPTSACFPAELSNYVL